MSEFTRHKSLNQTYKRLVLSENDLVRVATIVNTLAEKFGQKIEIKIISGDGEETIKTSDPNFFTSPHMLTIIRSVSIVYDHYDVPVSCRVEISSNQDGKVSISVDGTDREVASGVFHELGREFKLRQSFGAKFSQSLDNIGVSFGISLLASAVTAIAIYLIFDTSLNFIASKFEEFNTSSLQKILQTIGWMCTFAGGIAGSITIVDLLKEALPGVEFSGRLSGTNAGSKSKIIWVISVIFLPIIVNVFSNFLTAIMSIK